MSDSSAVYIENRKRELARQTFKCPHCGNVMTRWEWEFTPCRGCVVILQQEQAAKRPRGKKSSWIKRLGVVDPTKFTSSQ